MRILKYIILSVFLIILIIISSFCLYVFVIGKVKDVSTYFPQDLLVTAEKITFTPMFATSADMMNHYSYRVKDDVMYIKIKSVLVGGLGVKNDVIIYGDFAGLEKIMLEDNVKNRLIWGK